MKTLEELKQKMEAAYRSAARAAERDAHDATALWLVARNAYYKKLKEN